MDNRSAAICFPWFVFDRLQGRPVDGLRPQLSSALLIPMLAGVPNVPEWQCHIPGTTLPFAPKQTFHFHRNQPSTWAEIRIARTSSSLLLAEWDVFTRQKWDI
jgi:hypothetical protein